eukprot:13200_4
MNAAPSEQAHSDQLFPPGTEPADWPARMAELDSSQQIITPSANCSTDYSLAHMHFPQQMDALHMLPFHHPHFYSLHKQPILGHPGYAMYHNS